MEKLLEIHRRNLGALLALPGCTAVAVGKKQVAGQDTDVDSIVVFVREKGAHAPADTVPPEIEGVLTDVVQRRFGLEPMATNPQSRFDPLIGGITVSSYEDAMNYGSIGCFVQVGAGGGVPPGTYLLTNAHVLQVAATHGSDPHVIQPAGVTAHPPDDAILGQWELSGWDGAHDWALASMHGRGCSNVVPNHPMRPGNRALRGTAQAAVGDRVYKYGAATKHTEGVVTHIAYASAPGDGPAITNAIYIQAGPNTVWCNGGDSGSVAVRWNDDMVVGLNFRADTQTELRAGGFRGGLAYDIAAQLAAIGPAVALA